MKIYPVLLLIAVLYGCNNNKTALLRLKYKVGEQQSFVISVKAICNESAFLKSETDATLTADSIKNNNSEYVMTGKIDAIKADIKIPDLITDGTEVKYDSQKNYADMDDQEKKVDALYNDELNNYYSITLSDRGEILKPFNLKGKKVKQPLQIGLLQVKFPEQKVKVGDSWNRLMRVTSILPGAKPDSTTNLLTLTYTAYSITDEKVELAVNLLIKGFLKSSPLIFRGDGKYTIDTKNGRLINGYIKIPQPYCDDVLISFYPK